MRAPSTLFALIAAALVLAACGDAGETTSYTTRAPDSAQQAEGADPTRTPDSTATPEPTPSPSPTPTPTPEETAAQTAGGGKPDESIEIVGTEFAFEPAEVTAEAGRIELVLDNQGQAPHELVVLDTDTPVDELPTGDDGRAEEEGKIGETPEIPGGEKTSTTIDFEPGEYALICNLPGHYQGGMYGTMTVE
jgi:uncharacterized cupredoxin-like copper-binding protein